MQKGPTKQGPQKDPQNEPKGPTKLDSLNEPLVVQKGPSSLCSPMIPGQFTVNDGTAGEEDPGWGGSRRWLYWMNWLTWTVYSQ